MPKKKCLFCADDLLLGVDRMVSYHLDCSRQVARISWAASYLVKKAIKKGKIPVLDGSVLCVDCGKQADRYDHRDYAKPLDVVPVCHPCNVRRGPANHFFNPESDNKVYPKTYAQA